jgi:hypothetical protein
MEKLSTSIAKSLSDMVRDSLRAALADSVLPLLEKAHTQIFRQVNAAFQAGTKECQYHNLQLHTYISLTLYPRRGSRGISDIAPRCPRFTNIT